MEKFVADADADADTDDVYHQLLRARSLDFDRRFSSTDILGANLVRMSEELRSNN